MAARCEFPLRTRFAAGLLLLVGLLAIPGCGDEPAGDTTPPHAPHDLTVTGVTAASVTVRWIAPGDDGAKGTAGRYDIRYSTMPPQHDSWWDSSTVAIADPPSPRSAGEVESLTIRGLAAETDYHLALRAADEEANWSRLSDVVSARTASSPDTIPPAAITDLAIAAATDSSITLLWTAPGDDGSEGSAHRYQLRHAPEELREENWASAVTVPNAPLPLPPGTVQSCEVAGLIAGREYWFAIRAVDESANVAAISNPVAGSPDGTAPAAVRDLRVVATTTASVTLEWTSPGTEGEPGDAAIYDLRFALEPVTATSWDAASRVSGVPAPRESGATERFEVTGLAADTLHYFAVKTGDGIPNWSAISNIALGSTRTASGRILRVAPDGFGEFPTIDDAVAASVEGDIIELEDGIFGGIGNRGISYRGKAITIRSRSCDPQTCVLDCEGASRAFSFQYEEGSASILQGVTIRNGYAGGARGRGGALLCDELASPTILDCVFESNGASESGGAVQCNAAASPQFLRCRFQGNSAEVQGGAIESRGGAIIVDECLFLQNEAKTGGAMNGYGTWHLTRSRFRENTGRGLDSMGGALAIWASPRIEDCVFDLNQAGDGGAIMALFGEPTIENCTFALNDAGRGGAVYLYYGALTFRRVLIAYNLGLEAVAITDYVPPFICCDIYGNQGGDWAGPLAGQEQTEGNMEADPRFCDLDQGDLGLRPDSPCAPDAAGCGRIGGGAVGCGRAEPGRPWLRFNR